jgi:SnoaL-like protein
VQTEQRRHNLINTVFHSADADTAVAWAYLMLTSNAGGNPTVITTGFYTFTLQQAESEWRIAKLFVGMDNAARHPTDAPDRRGHTAA